MNFELFKKINDEKKKYVKVSEYLKGVMFFDECD